MIGIFNGDWSLSLYFMTDLVIVLVLMKTLLWWNGRKFLAGFGEATTKDHLTTLPSAIAWGGDVLALSILMTSLLQGEFSLSLQQEALLVFSYGLLAIILLKVGERLHWLILFRKQPQNQSDSMAMAMVHASHAIALAILFQPVLMRSGNFQQGILDTVAVFVIAQLLLLGIGLCRIFVYQARHKGKDLRAALKSGHEGLGVRYFGHMVGSALVVSSAASISGYLSEAFLMTLVVWSLLSILLSLGLSALTTLGRKMLLPNVNIIEQVDERNDTPTAVVEALLYISMALILMGLSHAWV